VEFVSHATAERILQTYNGIQMPDTEQLFRLNWASFGLGERRLLTGPEHSIFVGDLSPDVTDYLLQETFRSRYPSVRGAKVVLDTTIGRSKGYGFVKFVDENERNHAMTEMNNCIVLRDLCALVKLLLRSMWVINNNTLLKDAKKLLFI
jgi:RNA recognition motif-containing protein